MSRITKDSQFSQIISSKAQQLVYRVKMTLKEEKEQSSFILKKFKQKALYLGVNL